jgi:hypothetical protein
MGFQLMLQIPTTLTQMLQIWPVLLLTQKENGPYNSGASIEIPWNIHITINVCGPVTF